MPSLAEYQRQMYAYLLAQEESAGELAAWCAGDVERSAARLATYRNTCSATLVNALRLSYPAVRQVLGAEFFDAHAAVFARLEPPVSAYLNDYGERFGTFIAELPATAPLTYLPDLARLEWAVNRALHAPDCAPLDPARLQGLEPGMLAQVCFRAHPSISVLPLHSPAEQLWQAVLARDDDAMRRIDLTAGAGWVLVERDASHAVQIARVPEPIARVSAQLFAGVPLYAALDACGDAQQEQQEQQAEALQVALAQHLAAGRLVDFFLHQAPREGLAT